MSSADPQPVAPDRPRTLHLSRLVAAVVLTFAVLLYASGRMLIQGIIDGRPPMLYLVMTVVGVVAVMALTAGLSSRLASPRIDRFVTRALPAVWVLVNAALFWTVAGALLSKWITVPLFVLASLWVVWCGWMFYRRWSLAVRIGGLTICLLLTAAFVGLLRVDGIGGQFRVDFAWRFLPKVDHGAELPTAVAEPTTLRADLATTTPDDFPQFLGPNRTAVIPGANLAPDWKAAPPREVWRKSVGAGWSAFAVVGDFAVTQEQRRNQECVVCYRVSNGEPVWLHADEARFDKGMGGPGPRATPTIVDGRVYTVGGTGLLNCLEGASGQPVWSVDIEEDNGGSPTDHGVCGSPLVVDDWVIVAPNGMPGACLAAYDRKTGKRIWRGGQHRASYGSPALVEFARSRQVLIITADGIEGNDFLTGAPLWSYDWTGDLHVNCSQPVVVDPGAGRILYCTGYGQGSVLLDVLPGSEGTWSASPVWTSREMKTKFTTAVLYDGHVYGLDDGVLACVDLANGKRLWKGGHYEHGQVLLVGNLLIVQAEAGDVCLVRPDPKKLIELGRIPALAQKTWNNPALSGRMLLVRNDQEAACYELPVVEEPKQTAEK